MSVAGSNLQLHYIVLPTVEGLLFYVLINFRIQHKTLHHQTV